jgi:hypothetical protein
MGATQSKERVASMRHILLVTLCHHDDDLRTKVRPLHEISCVDCEQR